MIGFFQSIQWTEVVLFYVAPLSVLGITVAIGWRLSRAETARLDRTLQAVAEIRGEAHITADAQVLRADAQVTRAKEAEAIKKHYYERGR